MSETARLGDGLEAECVDTVSWTTLDEGDEYSAKSFGLTVDRNHFCALIPRFSAQIASSPAVGGVRAVATACAL